MDNGQLTMDSGQLTMDSGQWIMDNGQLTIDNGQLTMSNGEWTVDKKRTKDMENEQFNKNKEVLIVNSDLSIIKVDNLTKSFGNFTAVNAISFEVSKGEIFGFLGANGAGKTTAMRMLCGLSKPTSGRGTVAGFDIEKQPEQVKKNIGYMSQKFALYDDLKVWENLRLFGGIYGMKSDEIEDKTNVILHDLGFENERNTFVKSLPLGWKQKLAFSVSIFHEPKIVFLDEPTGGVDPAARRQFWELIYAAAESGITAFVTTHYMDEAEYCDRVLIMVDGKIVVLDTPKSLKAKFNAANMDEVFQQLARKAKRVEDG